MIRDVFLSFFATVFFAYTFNVSKKEIFCCGITGAIGYFVYLIVFGVTLSDASANFLAAFSLAYAARVFAVIRKTPFTVYLTPGIIPLVPGLMVYQTVYNFIMKDYLKAVEVGVGSLMTAGAIVTGIVVSLTLPRRAFLFGGFGGKS